MQHNPRGVRGEYSDTYITTPLFRRALDKYVMVEVYEAYRRYRQELTGREPVVTASYILGDSSDSKARWISGYLPQLKVLRSRSNTEISITFDDADRRQQLSLITQSLNRLVKQGKLRTSVALDTRGREVRAYDPVPVQENPRRRAPRGGYELNVASPKHVNAFIKQRVKMVCEVDDLTEYLSEAYGALFEKASRSDEDRDPTSGWEHLFLQLKRALEERGIIVANRLVIEE